MSTLSLALHRIVYVSTSVPPFTEKALVNLLTQARQRNHEAGITGMLLYKEGNWMQLLEGSAQEVRNTFDRIRSDTRHQDITTVLEEPVAARLFDQWSMGFRNLSGEAVESISGFTDFMSRGHDRHGFKPDPSGCLEILRLFRDG